MSVFYLYTDADLVAGCLKNKRLFQKRLYDRYASELLGVVMRYIPAQKEAEDILQDGFISIFEKLPDLKEPVFVKFWMKRIMINKALRYLEKRRGIVFQDVESFSLVDNSGGILADMAAKDLLRMIGELPSNARLVFNMFCIDGYTHAEISERLNISTGTSKSQVYRARNILKAKILNENQNNSTEISVQAG